VTLLSLPPTAMPADERIESQHLLDLDPLPRDVGVARQFVRQHLPALDDPGRDAVILLTSELVTNVVIHARTPLQLGVTVSTHYVVITVRDLDLGRTEQLPNTREGGRGLLIVEALADGFGMHYDPSGGKTAWFRVARNHTDEVMS
jgi:anti-sigma regulatory factor (Ser/Thr protein kinase)